MLPSKIASGSAQQDTKYDRDQDVTRDCAGVNQGDSTGMSKMQIPVRAFTTIESGWSGVRKSGK